MKIWDHEGAARYSAATTDALSTIEARKTGIRRVNSPT
jgi:hypothetical protein